MSFEQCSVVCAIGGDIRSVVPKTLVSVAEILVLQHLHGANAVTLIQKTGDMDTTSDAIRDGLGNIYGDDLIVSLFQQFGDLPKTLADARIGDELMDPVWLSDRAKKQTKKPRKVEEVVAEI